MSIRSKAYARGVARVLKTAGLIPDEPWLSVPGVAAAALSGVAAGNWAEGAARKTQRDFYGIPIPGEYAIDPSTAHMIASTAGAVVGGVAGEALEALRTRAHADALRGLEG